MSLIFSVLVDRRTGDQFLVDPVWRQEDNILNLTSGDEPASNSP